MKKKILLLLFYAMPMFAEYDTERYEKITGVLIGSSLGSVFGRWHHMNGMGIQGFFENMDGEITGDQQLVDITLQHAVFAKKNNVKSTVLMGRLAHDFASWGEDQQGGKNSLRLPRSSTLMGCQQLNSMLRLGYHKINNRWWVKGTGVPFDQVQTVEADIGSALHAYPFGIVFYDDIKKAIDFAAEHSLLTHRSKEARGACAAMAAGVAMIVQGHSYKLTVEKMIAAAGKYSGLLVRFMREAVDAVKEGVDARPFLRSHATSSAVDVMASTVYLFYLNSQSLVNSFDLIHRYCKDTTAVAMNVGALVGGYAGIENIDAAGYGKLENFDDIMHAITLIE